jgi:hypothetical protein
VGQLQVCRQPRRLHFSSIHLIKSHNEFLQLRYTVIPFVPGYDDIAGNTLKLDHITDTNERPLDELLSDHFLQGVLKNMKGTSEPTWDYEDALGGGVVDLSRLDISGGQSGREHLEFEIAHRLHSLQVAQESDS